jgi:hypothetical protein
MKHLGDTELASENLGILMVRVDVRLQCLCFADRKRRSFSLLGPAPRRDLTLAAASSDTAREGRISRTPTASPTDRGARRLDTEVSGKNFAILAVGVDGRRQSLFFPQSLRKSFCRSDQKQRPPGKLAGTRGYALEN